MQPCRTNSVLHIARMSDTALQGSSTRVPARAHKRCRNSLTVPQCPAWPAYNRIWCQLLDTMFCCCCLIATPPWGALNVSQATPLPITPELLSPARLSPPYSVYERHDRRPKSPPLRIINTAQAYQHTAHKKQSSHAQGAAPPCAPPPHILTHPSHTPPSALRSHRQPPSMHVCMQAFTTVRAWAVRARQSPRSSAYHCRPRSACAACTHPSTFTPAQRRAFFLLCAGFIELSIV